ncbi:hypothetical protein BDV93DRAFT_520138 [Ceratobasidium sp. AG-I]|nr:hypothetical protein BDV93DRAFT_520138 [Ceratobasidium sp. AG-I]
MASVLVLLYFPLGYALPTPDVQRVPRALGTGDGASKPGVKVIVPVVIAVVAFIMLLAFGWWRRRRRNHEFIAQMRNNSSTANTTATPATTSNANPVTISAPGTGPDAPARPARRRRRRRASQISTKSLPAYNEQAGDEEIVLVRRAQRDSMTDDDDDEEDGTQEGRRRPTNETFTSMDGTPLLDDASPERRRMSLASSTRGRSVGDRDQEEEQEQELEGQRLRPESSSAASASPSTIDSPTNDTPAPQQNTETTAEVNPSPLGDAPAYSEADLANHEEPAATHENTNPEHVPSSDSRPSIEISGPPPEVDGLGTIRAKRKSAFRQFFGLNRAGSSSGVPSDSVEMAPAHRQSLSASSAQASGRHRPSNSISTLSSMSPSGHGHTLSPSLSSLLLTRSRSPTRSTDSLAQRMNISAPIPTTLIRTELSYPRSGPTPEQIRFLSSRESLGRFGMPYGEEALAAARSRENISAVLSPPLYEAHSPGNATSEISADSITDSRSPRAAAQTLGTARAPPLLTPGEIHNATSPPSGMIRSTETSSPPPDDHSTPPTEPSPEVTAENDRRASVFTTNSFVTAAEGDGDSATEDDTVEAPDLSPPTPTAETYRQAEAQDSTRLTRPRGQTILIPESQGDNGHHPELSFIPATPTVEVSQRNNDIA